MKTQATYAACLFLNSRFCCFSSLISCSSVDCEISWSMLVRFLSAGISNRAFFFRIPSPLLDISGCERRVGLWGLILFGIDRCSIASDTDHSFCGDVGIDPLLVFPDEKRGSCWLPGLVKGVCIGRWKMGALTSNSGSPSCPPCIGVLMPDVLPIDHPCP